MKKNRNAAILAAVLLTATAAGATGAYAYYTAQTATAENSFSIVAGGNASGAEAGNVDEVFDSSTAQNLSPRSTFTKEAKLTSNVDYESYAYIMVTIPTINSKLTGETAKSAHDAVTLNFDTSKWDLVKKTQGDLSEPSRFLYRCKTTLAPAQSTGNLFDTATVPDFTETEGLSGKIDVTGYMLSSANVTTAEADADAIANFF